MDVILAGLTLLAGTSRDVLPIVLFIFGFQAFVIRQPIPNLKHLLSGLVLVIVGLTLFLLGLEQALFPVGRLMAEQLTATDASGAGSNGYLWVYLFAVAIGFSTAIAEPALLAVAIKANETSGGAISVWGLRVAVAVGVAIGVGLGAYRIISGTPLHYFMIVGYIIVVIQTVWAPKLIIPLAYDSGGVTTSTVTVPLVAALGLGLAEAVPGRSQLLDGFGLVASACLFPIIAVLAYAQISLLWSYLRDRRPGDTNNISLEEN
jgi:hypothetical protein